VGALIALPPALLVGWGFSRYFPIAPGLSVGMALLVSTVITAIVLGATWLPARRAVAVEPRDALWRE
jgi:ABC-type lipoprotein release transport system permease subunit